MFYEKAQHTLLLTLEEAPKIHLLIISLIQKEIREYNSCSLFGEYCTITLLDGSTILQIEIFFEKKKSKEPKDQIKPFNVDEMPLNSR